MYGLGHSAPAKAGLPLSGHLTAGMWLAYVRPNPMGFAYSPNVRRHCSLILLWALIASIKAQHNHLLQCLISLP